MPKFIRSQVLSDGFRVSAGISTPTHTIISDTAGSIHIFSGAGEQEHEIIEQYQYLDCENRISAMVVVSIGSKESEQIVCADASGRIKAYSRYSGYSSFSFPDIHKKAVVRLALVKLQAQLDPDSISYNLVSTDVSGRIVVWDLEKPTAIHILEGHTTTVKNISLLPDDKTLVTGSHDGTIRLWDTMLGLCKMTLRASEKVGQDQEGQQDLPNRHVGKKKFAETVSAMQVLENSRIVSGGVGGFVRIWDGLTGTLLTTWQAHFDGNPRVGPVLNNILLHPSGRAFVTTGTDGRVCLWDIQTFSLLRSINPLEHSVTAITFHQSSIVCGGKDGGGSENACGLFAKTILWDLSQLRLDPGVQEDYIQLGGHVSYVKQILTNGRDLVIVYVRGDTGVIDFWVYDSN